MFNITDIVMFALGEFRRGLDGLTDDEARWRPEKADGTEMNAISWTVCHIGGHWLWRPALSRPGTRHARRSGRIPADLACRADR
jgi:hypothetical protein